MDNSRNASPPEIRRSRLGSDRSIAAHLFVVGASVSLVHIAGQPLPAQNLFRVVAQLPPNGGVLQYRIKGESDRFDRVVTEYQLARA